jgi:hypothetical protein
LLWSGGNLDDSSWPDSEKAYAQLRRNLHLIRRERMTSGSPISQVTPVGIDAVGVGLAGAGGERLPSSLDFDSDEFECPMEIPTRVSDSDDVDARCAQSSVNPNVIAASRGLRPPLDAVVKHGLDGALKGPVLGQEICFPGDSYSRIGCAPRPPAGGIALNRYVC